MARDTIRRWKTGAAALALGSALVLGGCDRADQLVQDQQAASGTPARLPDLPATLPLSPGEETPLASAPAAEALPDVAPVRAVRVADPSRTYAYADTAYDFADALGDAPPDYAFDYDDVDPWAWQGYDDSRVFAEPIDDGYRYYYYRAGAQTPYFVRDPDYGYGYDGGNLAVVYANDGAIVPWADYGPRLVYASRYIDRGRRLWRASRSRRLPVVAANWNARRPLILQSRRAWAEARVQQPGWAAYRQRYNRDARSYWRPEARRREADARRFAGWQRQDFRTPPPPRAIPAGWQQAGWARDARRYAPVQAERRALFAARQDPARFDTQRQQAIAARDRALEQRQTRLADQRRQALTQQRDAARDRDTRLAERRQREAQRAQAGQQRQAQIAERQQREQARAAQQAQRAQADQQRQAQIAERQQREQARAAQQAQRAQAGQEQQAQLAGRQQHEQARAARQGQREQDGRERQAQIAERQQREQARAAQQAQRAQAGQQRQAQIAERQQREQARAAQQAQRAQAGQERQAQIAQRQQREQARQSQAAERQQRATRQAERAQAAQARQAQTAERQQREQARAAQQAQREQANQARQAQMAERTQRDQARQAQMAQRAQADQARAAQQAQRAQADQARAAQQAQRAQADQARAARQQEQVARQQQRAERIAARPDRGGGRER